MAKGIMFSLLFLSIFILSFSSVLGETATYSAAFESPLCESGVLPCTADSTLLTHSGTYEPNYPNQLDACTDTYVSRESNYNGVQNEIHEITMTDNNGGNLEAGDIITVGWEGGCVNGDDDVNYFIYASTNPDAATPTWSRISTYFEDSTECSSGVYSDTTYQFTTPTFTVPSTPTSNYVAVRVIWRNNIILGTGTTDACPQEYYYNDIDDLVAQIYIAPPPTATTLQPPTDIKGNSATISGTFTYESATYVDAYFVVDTVSQSSTHYTTGTSHTQTLTGLTDNEIHTYKLCVDWDSGTVCGSEESFITLETPDIIYTKIDVTQPTTDTTARLKAVSYFRDYEDVTVYFVLNGVNQTRTTYNSVSLGATYFYHYESFTGLTSNTFYEFEMCIEYSDGTECNNGYSSTEYNFTTLKTDPTINIAGAYSVTETTATLSGSIVYEDFNEFRTWFIFDGTAESKTTYTYSGSSGETHIKNLIGLDDDTSYTVDLCIDWINESSLYEEVCYGEQTFTTVAYVLPYVNIIGAFDITNHETSLGATVFYGSYENMSLSYYLDDSIKLTTSYDQFDEFDTSEYFFKELTGLDFFTYYDYRLDIEYIDPNGLGAGSVWENEYGCTAGSGYTTLQTRFGVSYYPEYNEYVLSNNDCQELCNYFIGENDSIAAGDGCCYYVDMQPAYPFNECFISDGDLTHLGSTDFDSQIMNSSVPVPRQIEGTTYDFRTLEAYIPYITISGALDIAGTTATLTGTYYMEDYSSTVPFFRLNGEDLYPKNNYTNPTEPFTETYDLTGLETNTTYNMTFCVGYGLGWANIVCDAQRTFTTGYEPTFTWGLPTEVYDTSYILHWTIDFSGTTNVAYKLNDNNPTWLTSFDGVQKDWSVTGLDPETTYTNFVAIKYDTLGSTYYLNTSDQNVTTYYDNAFDDIWDNLLQGSDFAKILLGFVVLFGVITLSVGAFGKYNMKMGFTGILVMIILGTVIATLMNLFPLYILLLIITGSVLLLIAKNMFFSDEGGM